MTDGTPDHESLRRDGVEPPVVDVATHRPPTAPASGLGVLLAHGAGSDLDAPVLVAVATALASAGHLVVRANLGYRQRRPTGPPPRAEASVGDLAATWRSLRARHDDVEWVVGGASYGGRVASMLAADEPSLAGVLCLSYPLHPPRRPDRLRVAHLPAISAPMLVVQGTDDDFGGPDDLRPHLATTAGPATVLEVGGADHALHVPRTRSTDGRTHRVDAVIGGLAPDLAGWLADLVD